MWLLFTQGTRMPETISTSTASHGGPEVTTLLDATTVLARIMAALDHATPWEYAQVMDVIRDGELTAGDVVQVCDLLCLPPAVVLCATDDDLRSLDDVGRAHADRRGDLDQLPDGDSALGVPVAD